MDRLMIEYLRNKGMKNIDEQSYMDKFKEFMKYKRNSMRGRSMRHNEEGDFMPMDRDTFKRHGWNDDYIDMWDFDERLFDDYDMDNNMHKAMKFMRSSMSNSEHFNEEEARYVVDEMCHMENGRKHEGEKFDMRKAKEVCERYRGILPHSTSHIDVYVAINSQYHSYSELFKKWFGDNIDQKIIESAIVFWFKDINFKDKNKVAEYLKEY